MYYYDDVHTYVHTVPIYITWVYLKILRETHKQKTYLSLIGQN